MKSSGSTRAARSTWSSASITGRPSRRACGGPLLQSADGKHRSLQERSQLIGDLCLITYDHQRHFVRIEVLFGDALNLGRAHLQYVGHIVPQPVVAEALKIDEAKLADDPGARGIADHKDARQVILDSLKLVCG